MKRGLHHLVENYGALGGTPPRGFKREIIEIGKRRDGKPHKVSRWVPDSEAWDSAKKAWLMRASGSSYREIHESTHLYKNAGCYTTFYSNRIYLGELKFGEKVIQNYVPAMIDQHTWDLVQYQNKQNKQIRDSSNTNPGHSARVNSDYFLSGVAFCADCGSPLQCSFDRLFQWIPERILSLFWSE